MPVPLRLPPRATRRATTTIALALMLSSCFTGERPRLVADDSRPPISDSPIAAVVRELVEKSALERFTVSYAITTKFGGRETTGSVSYDANLGTAVVIDNIRYVFTVEGKAATCSTIDDGCESGTLEFKVSDRMLTSRFFRDSAVERLRQDDLVALGDSTASTRDDLGHDEVCTTIPVVDGVGGTQEKTYCVLSEFGVLSFMDTADVLIDANAVTLEVDSALFDTGTI